MKSYLILVQAEDYIEVDAESEDEAIEQALEIATVHGADDGWTATVISKQEID